MIYHQFVDIIRERIRQSIIDLFLNLIMNNTPEQWFQNANKFSQSSTCDGNFESVVWNGHRWPMSDKFWFVSTIRLKLPSDLNVNSKSKSIDNCI